MARGHMKHKELVKRMKEDELAKGLESVETWWERKVAPHLHLITAALLLGLVIAVGYWMVQRHLQQRRLEAMDQYTLAQKAFLDNDIDAARNTINSIKDSYANTPGGYLARVLEADILYAQANYGQALTIYEELLKTPPASLKQRLLKSKAATLESMREFDRARAIYEQLLAGAHSDAEKGYLYFRLGKLAQAENQTEAAIDYYRSVPEDSFYHGQTRQLINRLTVPVYTLPAS